MRLTGAGAGFIDCDAAQADRIIYSDEGRQGQGPDLRGREGYDGP